MAKRHKGTTRKATTAKPRKRTTKQAERPGVSGAEFVGVLDRMHCERLVLEALNALCSRTARPDGRRCVAFQSLDLATQYRAACLYLLDRKSLAEVAGIEDLSAVSTRVAERWIKIVKEEYAGRYSAALREAEAGLDLAAIRGDMPAMAQLFWSELVAKAVAFLRQTDYADLTTSTRNEFLRMGEGLTDQSKVSVDIAKTQAQTEKLRRQLLREVGEAGRRGGGKISAAEACRIIEEQLGLPGGFLGGGEAAA